MDGNGNLNLRNWSFIEAPSNTLKNHLGLQLMSSMAEKPLFSGGAHHHHHHHHVDPSPVMASTNGGPFHHHRVGGIPEPPIPIDYWMSQNRENKYFNLIPGNHNHPYYPSSYGISPESSSAHSIQLPHQQISLPKNDISISEVEEICEETDNNTNNNKNVGPVAVGGKKRGARKASDSAPKEKKPRTRAPRDENAPSAHRARTPKKRAEVVINGVNMDIAEIPIPVCSCTGAPQQCYRWGSGGWQSACCTTGLSMYPLPMSTKRRGARIAGRKMSIGAFKKVLEKLASEGYDFSGPIDLRSYWAKHGTNKFVTIR